MLNIWYDFIDYHRIVLLSCISRWWWWWWWWWWCHWFMSYLNKSIYFLLTFYKLNILIVLYRIVHIYTPAICRGTGFAARCHRPEDVVVLVYAVEMSEIFTSSQWLQSKSRDMSESSTNQVTVKLVQENSLLWCFLYDKIRVFF